MSFLNPVRIAPLSETMTVLENERAQLAARRDDLLEETQRFEDDLNRIVRPWIDKKDPVTERPYIAIEGVKGHAWGKRLRFYNRHFIEFTISNVGELSMFTSADGERHVFDAGMRFDLNAQQNAGQFVLQRTEGIDIVGTPLSNILAEHIAAAMNLPELPEDGDEK